MSGVIMLRYKIITKQKSTTCYDIIVIENDHETVWVSTLFLKKERNYIPKNLNFFL